MIDPAGASWISPIFQLISNPPLPLTVGAPKTMLAYYREAGTRGLEQFSETKSVYIDYSGRLQKAQIDNRESIT